MDSEDIDTLTLLGEHLINSILQRESLQAIKSILENSAPAWYQNEEEGMSALHAAAYIQDESLVSYLLANGAVWNAVDNLQHTAGEIALSFNNTPIYTKIRDAGIRAEMLLGLLASKSNQATSMLIKGTDDTAAASSKTFLESKLKFTVDEHGQEICSVQAGDDEIGVMMGWERPIMNESVKALCDGHPQLNSLKVLNVGFGLGIIDNMFQNLATPPALHVIIEPHPDVLQHMKDSGWEQKPGVVILAGKWQEFIDTDDLLSHGGFDIVYTDTFSENYDDLKAFFEHLPDLLAGSDSRFGFFNGLGATNALFYDVWSHLAELHLADVGLNVMWSTMKAEEDRSVASTRWGETRKYFTMPLYRLPVASMSVP